MPKTFGELLQQFSYSVDTVDKTTFEKIHTLVKEFTGKTLDMEITDILVEGAVGESTGLIKKGVNRAISVKDNLGNYTDLRAFSFDRKQPLWIVSKTKKLLIDCDDYCNLWTETQEDLPKYQKPIDNELQTRTAIYLPLKDKNNKAIGVLNMETESYLEITVDAKKELERITDALSILHILSDDHTVLRKHTEKALVFLESTLSERLPQLKKPNVFLASSTIAEDEVIGTIKEVLSDLSDKLNLVFWKDIHEAGDINSQMLEKISTCRYGICYFSEKAISGEKGEIQYVDNLNVTFEAGMLHALTHAQLAKSPDSWLPIRENNSPPTPFDFASQRTLLIPRDDQNTLNTESFKDSLKKRINEMLES
jgi:hypothetical protein